MALSRYRIQIDYYHEIDFYLKSFQLYTEQINQVIDTEITLAENEFKTIYGHSEETPYFYDKYSNLQAKKGLTDIYYDSLIITIYSFIERKMRVLSERLSKSKELKLNDIAGSGIIKYRTYLLKVCNIDFTPIETEWRCLIGFNKLRNHLVHSEGNRSIAEANDKGLIDFLKTIQGISLNEDKETKTYTFHFTSKHTLLEFIEIARTIIKHLYFEQT